MLTIDDYAIHQRTGKSGKVIGYDRKIIDNSHVLMVKVCVQENDATNQSSLVIEDLASKWMPMK